MSGRLESSFSNPTQEFCKSWVAAEVRAHYQHIRQGADQVFWDRKWFERWNLLGD